MSGAYSQDQRGSSSINIRQTVEQHWLMVSCTVERPKPNLAVHMFCPLVPEPLSCFQGCRHSCIGSGKNRSSVPSGLESCPNYHLLEDIECYMRPGNGELTVSYRFSSYNPEISGSWFCAHDGKKSSVFSVVAEKRPTTTTSTTTATTTTAAPITSASTAAMVITKPQKTTTKTTTTQKPQFVIVKKPSLPPGPPKKKPENPPNFVGGRNGESGWPEQYEQKDDFMNEMWINYLTKTDVVFCVLLMLLLSLLINLVCCIRCLLVRRLATSGDTTCLEICLCVPRGSNYQNKCDSIGSNNLTSSYPVLIHGVPYQLTQRRRSSQNMGTADLVLTPSTLYGGSHTSLNRPSLSLNGFNALPRSSTFPVPVATPHHVGMGAINPVAFLAGGPSQQTLISRGGATYITPDGQTLYAVGNLPANITSNHIHTSQAMPLVNSSSALHHTSRLLYDDLPTPPGQDAVEQAGGQSMALRPSASLSSLQRRHGTGGSWNRLNMVPSDRRGVGGSPLGTVTDSLSSTSHRHQLSQPLLEEYLMSNSAVGNIDVPPEGAYSDNGSQQMLDYNTMSTEKGRTQIHQLPSCKQHLQDSPLKLSSTDMQSTAFSESTTEDRSNEVTNVNTLHKETPIERRNDEDFLLKNPLSTKEKVMNCNQWNEENPSATSSRLELSRNLLRQADTLLREADCLLLS